MDVPEVSHAGMHIRLLLLAGLTFAVRDRQPEGQAERNEASADAVIGTVSSGTVRLKPDTTVSDTIPFSLFVFPY